MCSYFVVYIYQLSDSKLPYMLMCRLEKSSLSRITIMSVPCCYRLPHVVFGIGTISPSRFLTKYCKKQLNRGCLFYTVDLFVWVFRVVLVWVLLPVIDSFVGISQASFCQDWLQNDRHSVRLGIKLYCTGRSGLVVTRLLAFCARRPRFESRCRQKFVFFRKSLQYAALSTGCTLIAVPRSTQPSTLWGMVNEYQPYGWVIIHDDGRMFCL